MKGTIVKYDTGRRFGFIRSGKEGEDDIFFHRTDVKEGDDNLRAGASVRYEIGQGDKGPKAVDVRVLSQPTSPYYFYLGGAAFVGVLAFTLLRMFVHPLTLFADYLLAVNLAAFVLTGFDKSIAGSGSMRVPEAVLFGIGAIGGSLGLLIGMRFFRHKTKKASFQFILIVILFGHAVLARLSHFTVHSLLRTTIEAYDDQE